MNESDNLRYSEFATTKEACDILHVAPDTLRRWEKNGAIEASRTAGKQRRYNLRKYFGTPVSSKRYIIYARVSGAGRSDDLGRQVELLQSKYPTYTVIKDIGSGLNFKRKGLKTLVGYLVRGEVQEIVVTHRDRLSRFGFELFAMLMFAGNPKGKIVVLNRKETTPEGELVEDILSILTSFSGRLHGLKPHQSAIEKTYGVYKDPIDPIISHPPGETGTQISV